MSTIPKAMGELSKKIQKCVRVYNRDEYWRHLDNFLELMCRQFPNHESLNLIITKVTAIDRLYMAMLYRQNKVNYLRIAQCLLNSSIDDFLSSIGKNLNLKKVHKVSRELDSLAGLGDPDNPRYVVFASKYLHFHKRDLFPIIDSFSEKKLDKLCNNLGLELNNENRNKNYGRYEYFCRQLLILQDALYKNTGYKASWSDFDKYLYGERYLGGQK